MLPCCSCSSSPPPPPSSPPPPPPAGQEEVDDVIRRDMHRTFPEHPMFSAEEGQCALFRVLKAYSLHDLEVKMGGGGVGKGGRGRRGVGK